MDELRPSSQWRYVKYDPSDKTKHAESDMWFQSEELMRSLVAKQQRRRLRPLHTAPDAVAFHESQMEEFDMAQWNFSTMFRPMSVPSTLKQAKPIDVSEWDNSFSSFRPTSVPTTHAQTDL